MKNIYKNKTKSLRKIIFSLLLITNFISYSQDGSLDLTFNTMNDVTTGSIMSFAVQSDNKIIIVGRFSNINGTIVNKVTRLNQDGSLDSTFNIGTGLSGNMQQEAAYKVIIQPDGKIIIAGEFSTFNGVIKNSIVRLNTNGSIDTSFITGTGFQMTSPYFGVGKVPGQIADVKLRNNGQIIIKGGFHTYNGISSNSTKGLCVINANGTLDTSFDAFSISSHYGSAMEVQPDGKIIIAVIKITQFGGGLITQDDYYLRRLNVNGSLDSSFTLNNTILRRENIGGVPFSNFGDYFRIYGIKCLTSGKIMVYGSYNNTFGINNKNISRLNSNGTVDTTFLGGGVLYSTTSSAYGSINSIDIQPDNKIIIGGNFVTYAGVSNKNIARINSNGTYDSTFISGTGFTDTNNTLNSYISYLKQLPNQTLLTLGNYVSYNGVVRNSIARLNGPTPIFPIIANPDTATTTFGVASTPIVNVRANDTYNGAAATSSNTTLSFVSSTNSGITLNSTTGGINVSGTVPVGTYTLVYKICAKASPTNCTNGTVTITVIMPIATINANDDYSYATNGVLSTAALNVRANDTYNSVQATSSNSTLTFVSSTNAGINLTASGAVTVSSSVPVGMHTLVYKLCNATLCDNATVYITVYPQSDTSVNAVRANKTVQQIGLQSNGKIIISGGFTLYNNITANYFTRLNSNLTLDTTFLSSGPQLAYPPFFLIQPDDKIVLVFRGNVTTYNGVSIPNGIVRLNANGSIDTTFNVGGTGIATTNELVACAMQSDGKILIGGKFLTSYNGQAVKNLIRLNSNGTLDTTFDFAYSYNSSSFACGAISNIVVQPDNKIIVGGSGNSSFNGQPNIVRLNSNGSIDTSFAFGLTGYSPSDYSAICTSCLAGIQDIELQPDGKVIVSGAFSSYNYATTIKNIVRLNSNGSVDTGFNVGSSTDRVIKDVSIDPISGKMYIGGEFTKFNTLNVKKIIRLNSNGSYDSTFNIGTGTADSRYASNPFYYNNIFSTKLQSDGKLLIGGNFTLYNGISATNITRLLPAVAGSQGRSFNEIWTSETEIDDAKSFNIKNNTVTLFPNPSNGIFNFKLSNLDQTNSSIEIFNILGERIFFSDIIAENSEIDLSKFPSGYYIGIIKNGELTHKLKLIKK